MDSFPSTELPPDVAEAIKNTPRPRGRVQVNLAKLDRPRFDYKDADLTLSLPVPTVDVFDALLIEHAQYKYARGMAEKEVDEAKRVGLERAALGFLARAFWLVCQYKPPLRLRPRWEYPKVKDQAAYDFYREKLPYPYLVENLSKAMGELIEYASGKKKRERPLSTAE